MLAKLLKRIYETVCLTFAAFSELLAYRQNAAILSLFYWYYFGMRTFELTELFHLSILMTGLLFILTGCLIFLSPFLDANDLNDFKSRVTCFFLDILNAFNPLFLLFPVTPCLLVPVHS